MLIQVEVCLMMMFDLFDGILLLSISVGEIPYPQNFGGFTRQMEKELNLWTNRSLSSCFLLVSG
jgi:hypothetical protein